MKASSDISDSLSKPSCAFLDLVDSNEWKQARDWSPDDSIESRLDEGFNSRSLELDPHYFLGSRQALNILTPDYEFTEIDDLHCGELHQILDLEPFSPPDNIDEAIIKYEHDLILDRSSFSHWTDSSRSLKPVFYSNLASSAFHILLIFVATFVAWTEATGQAGKRQQPLFVSLVDSRSDEVCATKMASIDSASSLPSIADRSRKNRKESSDEDVPRTEESLEDKKTESSNQEPQGADVAAVNTARVVDSNPIKDRDSTYKDEADFKSKSFQDSSASLSSTAGVEKRSAATYGNQINEFKLKLLQAIHEAAYFPKKALRSKNFGEVLVSFAVIDSGELQDLRIDKSSGSKALDEAALQILQRAAEHFPRIPEHSELRKLTYVVPISFRK